MATIFAIDDEPGLDELCRDVTEQREAGRVHVEFRRLGAPSGSDHAAATAFVEALGMKPPEEWTDLDAKEAHQLATRVLHADLAYESPMMTAEQADLLARRFLSACGHDAVFVTNGTLGRDRTGGGWSPLTTATFDTGVIGISASRLGLLWVEDED